jgi:hypothetical protein
MTHLHTTYPLLFLASGILSISIPSQLRRPTRALNLGILVLRELLLIKRDTPHAAAGLHPRSVMERLPAPLPAQQLHRRIRTSRESPQKTHT